eukprot:Skav213163  [mRNA]  locus=scaffold31:203081:204427:- [translate_table: standard]
MALVALVLHVPVACFLRRLYHQTPFREALELYEQQIQCTPYTGPDADHPYNHGLQALTLRGFCQHFEGFILEYNMHFVVSNLANNQWNIAAELGTDPMSSAFARVLTNGPKEVAMVLDKERWAMIPN